jgi:hypothetical protein
VAVCGFQRGDDARLQRGEEFMDRGRISFHRA